MINGLNGEEGGAEQDEKAAEETEEETEGGERRGRGRWREEGRGRGRERRKVEKIRWEESKISQLIVEEGKEEFEETRPSPNFSYTKWIIPDMNRILKIWKGRMFAKPIGLIIGESITTLPPAPDRINQKKYYAACFISSRVSYSDFLSRIIDANLII